MKKIYFLLLFLLVLCRWNTAQATHIFGGDFEMNYLGPGRYNVTLVLFIDEKNASSGAKQRLQDYVTVSIFRKRDNAKMMDIRLFPQPLSPVRYDECGNLLGVETTKYSFSTEVSLTPAQYSDALGYYIAWQDCCRNNVVANLLNSGNTGMTFYLEFPALTSAGGNVVNSSPKFTFPEGQIICLNDLTSIDFSATDADGDRLEYYLVTPYASYGGNSNRDTPPQAIRSGTSYPPVLWRQGYDENNMIPGSPALTINRQTGVMQVRATERGVAFVVGVEVREFRNGVQIGLVRRDYQFQVTECTPPPPPPTIFPTNATTREIIEKGVKTIDFCEEGFIDISTKDSINYVYQWFKDDQDIKGATTPKLRVTAPGKYYVQINTRGGCSRKSISEITTVNAKPSEGVRLTANVPTTTCEDKNLTLSVRNSPNFTYVWIKDTDTLKTQTRSSLGPIRESGRYRVLVKSRVSDCTYLPDTNVVIYRLPEAKITNTRNLTTICEDDRLPLSASVGTGHTYEWRLNGTAIAQANGQTYDANKAGDYTVVVTDANKCTNISLALRLTVNPSPVVTMDSIRPVCGTAIPKILLTGSPAGGKFEGNSVIGNEFFPFTAGFGRFVVKYTYTNQFQCSRTATRTIEVVQAPSVKLGADRTITKGESIPIGFSPGAATNGATYQWTPPSGLSSPTVSNPSASPDATVTYRLKVTFANGCSAEDDLVITVFPKLSVPTGFTPNGDGTNDVWEIDGITNVPDCEVEVFNRWGDKVFFSKGYSTPFDGTRNGEKLPAATYYYVIKPNNGANDLKGVLTIVQ